MKLSYYVVDAFTQEVFKGNPAAVYVLEKWLPDTVMQKIAIENNLSETAFTVKKEEHYEFYVGLLRIVKSTYVDMLL